MPLVLRRYDFWQGQTTKWYNVKSWRRNHERISQAKRIFLLFMIKQFLSFCVFFHEQTLFYQILFFFFYWNRQKKFKFLNEMQLPLLLLQSLSFFAMNKEEVQAFIFNSKFGLYWVSKLKGLCLVKLVLTYLAYEKGNITFISDQQCS